MDVCKIWDDFMAHYAENNPIWIVVLNNGETIFRDDGRPGLSEHSAWIRLYHYCQKNNLYITHMTIGFRDNRYSLPEFADGYYFSLCAVGIWGSTKTSQFFKVGTLQNGNLRVQSWKVPEMLDQEWEERDPATANLCLITKPNNMLQYTAH